MERELESSYGYKAAILKKMSEDSRLKEYIPPMIFIPDTVFGDFISENTELQNKMNAWKMAVNEEDYDQCDEEIEAIKKLIRNEYSDYMKQKIPELSVNIQKKIGYKKKIIVRSSGLEDMENCINAGGNQSIPDVDVENIYEAIAEVMASYFSTQTLSILEEKSDRMKIFKCPILIQEMAGSSQKESRLSDYPVLESEIIQEIEEIIFYLEEKFQKPVDTEWVVTQGELSASVVGFSREPYYHSRSAYLLCSMGVGSAVRKTAIMNATHYLICVCNNGQNFYLESPEKNTAPRFFSKKKANIKLVQCRPAVIDERKLQKNTSFRYQEDQEKRYEIHTIVTGRGDVDGRFLIRETISEAWEEFISNENRKEYVGCIVRAGSALEHAGIMFTERRIPVVSVNDEAFGELLEQEKHIFCLCQIGEHCLFCKKDQTIIEYEEIKNSDVILPLKQASLYTSQEIVRWCEKEDQTGEIKDWNHLFDFYFRFSEIVKQEVLQKKEIVEMKEWLRYLYGGTGKNFQYARNLIYMLLELLKINQEREDSDSILLWKKVATMYAEGKLFLLLGRESLSLEEAFLFSPNIVDSRILPERYRKKYEEYMEFREKIGIPTHYKYREVKKTFGLYQKKRYDDNTYYILEKIFQGEKACRTAEVYLEILEQDILGVQDVRGEINTVLLAPWISEKNIRQCVMSLNLLIHFGGVGDLLFCVGSLSRFDRVTEWLGKFHTGEICQEIENIFEEHDRGVLDQNVENISRVRHILQKDLNRMEGSKIETEHEFYPVYSNIRANMIYAIIDLFDIEGKSYANSVAMGIYSIYPTWLAHLEEWNGFLRSELINGQDIHKETPDIIEKKLERLKNVPNYHVSIQVENMWFEKINMDLDFNLHELHNILHQASISFAAVHYHFVPSKYVKELYSRFLTFDLYNRRLLKNQSRCIEIELGLGNYKLHKSSIMIRPDRVSAEYVEAPFISIGRILVLQQLMEMLGERYVQYKIVTRLQKRSGDHLLFIHLLGKESGFRFDEAEFAAEIVCALFDSFELGGGLTEEEADRFIKMFRTEKFLHFLDCMIRYHKRLQYSEDMGGGLEENDKCIYQSLLALMVIFPERFEFLNTVTDYDNALSIIKHNLGKVEWETDKYELRKGWLKKTYCMCLAILYPRELRKSLRQQNNLEIPDRELCELYLKMIRN